MTCEGDVVVRALGCWGERGGTATARVEQRVAANVMCVVERAWACVQLACRSHITLLKATFNKPVCTTDRHAVPS